MPLSFEPYSIQCLFVPEPVRVSHLHEHPHPGDMAEHEVPPHRLPLTREFVSRSGAPSHLQALSDHLSSTSMRHTNQCRRNLAGELRKIREGCIKVRRRR